MPLMFFISFISMGGTYDDLHYFVNTETREIVIEEEFDQGAFGARCRLINAYEIIDGVRWFNYRNHKEMEGIWEKYDKDWKFLEYTRF